LIVAITNFAAQRWRFRTDRLGAAVDHFCNEINLAADIATEYWLLDASNQPAQEKARIREPMLIGRQSRIQELLIALADQDAHLPLSGVQSIVTEMIGAMTGGEFRVRGRVPDTARAQEVQVIAAHANGKLREALQRRNKRWV
jgi:hypothetical protein